MTGNANEGTALLSRPKLRRTRTPLPKLQLSVIMLIQISEPIASQSIYPYINQLVSELDITGGDEKKVGYYACESLFFLTESMTVLQWSRLSDRVGRKPILLIGLFGSGTSIFLFGLSRTFWGLVVSRCLCGLLNGNIGEYNTIIGDLTDKTNRAEGFAFLPIVWAIGASVGPLIGGNLQRPHERFPLLFSGKFWREFPYFLPCLVTGSLVFLSCFLTTPGKSKRRVLAEGEEGTHPDLPQKRKGPKPLRELLTFPVLISISNYVSLGFLNTTLGALLPLFLAMPVEIGGLGLPPPKIGLILSAYGLATGLFQILFFARMIHRWGEKRVYLNGMLTCLPVFGLFPIISLIARNYGVNSVVYSLVGCILALGALQDTAFGAIFMFLTASAPKSSRGSVNGISQTSVALARAIGPAMSTSLFSLSVQHNLIGGYMVYLVFFLLSGLALVLANETTSLLRPNSSPTTTTPTPLPKLQLAIIMLVQVCEPLTSQSIYPYINQLVSELDITGGDQRKVGYYALFFITEAITVFQWSRFSDRNGRKPVLLVGLIGSAVSMVCFGLSRTFWALVVSRCLTGLLNGNTGVMKSSLMDVTDSSNRAKGFAYFPLIWATGASLGPFIGGSLSTPQKRFPGIFPGTFWAKFPYFLPCLVVSGFVFFSFVVVLLLFKEVATSMSRPDPENVARTCPKSVNGPLPIKDLVVFPILISISNYVALAFLNIVLAALLPLFLAMPIEIGGLGLPPNRIGLILAVYGLKYPVEAAIDWVQGAIFMFVTASTPTSSRGTVNGSAQGFASLSRAIGPALSTSLFSFSVQHDILGGYAVYALFFVLSVFALQLGRQLPEDMWEEVDDI
ncbi:major facilitator superfamily domain-containing protein [Favolaschia claudopus]|uniref:Major facilitator superfamily domain-containing protein n=1 Tax=Favolaschia claudopus TaxID=2862362 RepID=A0AAW0C101_9AGAR